MDELIALRDHVDYVTRGGELAASNVLTDRDRAGQDLLAMTPEQRADRAAMYRQCACDPGLTGAERHRYRCLAALADAI